MRYQSNLTAEDRARKRAKEGIEVVWHVAVYVIVSTFLWFVDIAAGGGLDWAFWPTIGWGIVVAFHVATHVIDDNDAKGRLYQKFLAEEQARTNRHSRRQYQRHCPQPNRSQPRDTKRSCTPLLWDPAAATAAMRRGAPRRGFGPVQATTCQGWKVVLSLARHR